MSPKPRPERKYPFTYNAKTGLVKMSRKHLWKVTHRKPGEPMKEKELKCWTCGSLPHRVEGENCKDCGLKFVPEGPEEVEIPTLKSSAGTFENEF